jgi:hypothetical protein
MQPKDGNTGLRSPRSYRDVYAKVILQVWQANRAQVNSPARF